MYIGLGVMKEEAMLELERIRYRKKTVIKDQDLEVVIVIPISSEEKPGEETPTPVSAEEIESEKKEALEIFLVRPLIKRFAEIKSSIDRSIVVSTSVNPLNYVFPVMYNPKDFSKIALRDVEKSVHTASTASSLIVDVLKKVPLIEFEKAEFVKMLKIEKVVDIEVEPSIKILDYVARPRPAFHQLHKINYVRVDKEVGAKILRIQSLAGGVESASDEVLLEHEDVVKYFFNASLSRMVMDRPFLILARKPMVFKERFEYIEFLKRLLRELYRVCAGGLPIPIDIRTAFEEVKLDVEAGKHIYVIDVDEAFQREVKDDVAKYVADRLRELYSQGLGFLIFYGSQDKLIKLKESLQKVLCKTVQPVEIAVLENWRIYGLANLVWGKVGFELAEIENMREDVDLDSYAVKLEEEFYRKIVKLASDLDIIISVEPSKRDEERLGGESLLHYGVKAFVVKYLKEHEKIPDHNIFTEYAIGDIVVDVYTKHSKYGDLAIEVETLYGTTIPLLKLRNTIEARLSKGLRLWIVIPNPQLMLFLTDISKLRSIYRKRYGEQVEFYTLDIEKGVLVKLSEIVKKVKQLITLQRESSNN